DKLARPARTWSLGKPLDGDFAVATDLHFQFVTPQERHANQWVSICLIYQNAVSFAVPHHLGLVHVKKDFAAVGQDSSVKLCQGRPSAATSAGGDRKSTRLNSSH